MEGTNTVRLTLSGATPINIEIYRDGVVVATTPCSPFRKGAGARPLVAWGVKWTCNDISQKINEFVLAFGALDRIKKLPSESWLARSPSRMALVASQPA